MREISFSEAIENNLVVHVKSEYLKSVLLPAQLKKLSKRDRNFFDAIVNDNIPYRIRDLLDRMIELCDDDHIYFTLLLDCKWFIE